EIFSFLLGGFCTGGVKQYYFAREKYSSIFLPLGEMEWVFLVLGCCVGSVLRQGFLPISWYIKTFVIYYL
ncbi:MAG: hypothetical protein WBC81_14985, partial [Chitinophagaceae bacterium]